MSTISSSRPNIVSTLRDKTTDLQEIDLTLIQKNINEFDKHYDASGSYAAFSQLALACGDKNYVDPQWGLLAGRVLMCYIRTTTPDTFSESVKSLKPTLDSGYYEYISSATTVTGAPVSVALDAMVIPGRDDRFNLFGIATLWQSYLARLNTPEGSIVLETPQYMYLRIATYLHYPNLAMIKKVYDNLSLGNYSQASPTMFNAGMKKPQLSSCFLADVSDNMVSITHSWTQAAFISMNGGAIGVGYSKLRHSEIGMNGSSKGVIPWCGVLNKVLKAVDQNGKRAGVGAVYLRDCHLDIPEFIELRDDGPEDLRARDLFLGLMISDLFMKRVRDDGTWSLFCPNKSDGLFQLWGEKFEKLYVQLESAKRYVKQVKARTLWNNILSMQIKKGLPYILYIDACNRRSNHQHLGILSTSNLCTEILEYTSQDEIASCVLGTVCLDQCVTIFSEGGDGVPVEPRFDFDKLERLTAEMVENLDSVIDRNYYPPEVPEIKKSNFKHRPLGIGVQGMADMFAKLDMSWIGEDGRLDPRARALNRDIFECMYFAAISASLKLAKLHGHYESFPGRPLSKGIFQFDFSPLTAAGTNKIGRRSDLEWHLLRREVMKFGTRHSLLISLPPTATSANILDKAECFEPFNSMLYTRTVLSGQFVVINKYLVADLKSEGAWNTAVVRHLFSNGGSIQKLTLAELGGAGRVTPSKLAHLKRKYLTVFEISQKELVDMAVDRSPFICQTASQNCFMDKPTRTKLNAYHFYGWAGGLKTGMYYLRQKTLIDPVNMALNSLVIKARDEVPPSEDGVVSAHDDFTTELREVTSPVSYPEEVVMKSLESVSPLTSGQVKMVCTDDICVSCQT